MPPPLELTLALAPRARHDLLDVTARAAEACADFADFPRATYASHHTTAGFVDGGLLARWRPGRARLERLLGLLRTLFPAGAGYRHDRMDERGELSAAERAAEPPNGDSHLAYIGGGLKPCVTVPNAARRPAYLVELDGVHADVARARRATVVAFTQEREIARFGLAVPVSDHPIDAVNLADPIVGALDRIRESVRAHGVGYGRVDLSLAHAEVDASLTVNEYETLLMRHDLAEVLHDPLRFLLDRGKSAWRAPLAVPGKVLAYARYDAVRVWNAAVDHLPAGVARLERWLARGLAIPAGWFLSARQSVSLLVAPGAGAARDGLVLGRYQSPILVQWRQSADRVRRLIVTLHAYA